MVSNQHADKYDAAECLSDFRQTVRIHGDDVLSHVNWELDESWLKKYRCVLVLMPL
jgi:hypothetical protein